VVVGGVVEGGFGQKRSKLHHEHQREKTTTTREDGGLMFMVSKWQKRGSTRDLDTKEKSKERKRKIPLPNKTEKKGRTKEGRDTAGRTK